MELVCRDDLDEFASETDDELEQFAQDLEHRLFEDYESNPDDEDRGVGLLSRLSGTDSPLMIGRLIEADFLKDERGLTCTATVTREGQGNDGIVAKVEIVAETTNGLLTLGYSVNSDGSFTGGIVQ